VAFTKRKRRLDKSNRSLLIHCYPIGSTPVGTEALTAVIMKNSLFWAIMPGSPLKVQPMFQKKILPPYSGLNNKPSKIQA
jgi:molybdopterin-biosynthesis enzyme MoeA-like protein